MQVQIIKHGYNMAVITRIDARSKSNNSIHIQDTFGNIIATIEVMPIESGSDVTKLRNEANLRIQTADDIRIVKHSGAVLRKKFDFQK